MKRRVTGSTRSGQFSAVQFMCSEPAFMLSLGVRLRFRDMLVGWGQVWGADVCDGDFRGKGQMSGEEKSYDLGSSSSSSRMTSVVRRLSLNRGGSSQRTCRAPALSPPRSPGVRGPPARSPPPPLSVSLSDGHVTALPAGGRPWSSAAVAAACMACLDGGSAPPPPPLPSPPPPPPCE